MFEQHSHHATKDLTLFLSEDKYGQLKEIKGRGFRHINIYELINSKKRKPRAWIESIKDRSILWEPSSPRKWSGDVDALLAYRDACYPAGRCVVWDEELGFMLWDEPAKPKRTRKSKSL